MNHHKLRFVTEVKGNEIKLEGGVIITAYAHNIVIGEGSELSPGIEIGLPGKMVNDFIVGDHCRLYAGQIASRNFRCGDYVTMHEGYWAYGSHDIVVGHNGWFGKRCTLDAEGGFWVGNGFGAGQDTHMWSHIRHGDTLAGSRWLRYGEFVAGDDVWLTGRCTSAPAHHGDWSMAMVEANLTKDMPPNTVWGGNPAKNMTERLGAPYAEREYGDRLIDFNERLDRFHDAHPDVDLFEFHGLADRFDLTARTYDKQGSKLEVQLMRFLLPEAKFVPKDQPRIE